MTGFYNETSNNETKLREFVSFDITNLRRDPDFIRSKKLADNNLELDTHFRAPDNFSESLTLFFH